MGNEGTYVQATRALFRRKLKTVKKEIKSMLVSNPLYRYILAYNRIVST